MDHHTVSTTNDPFTLRIVSRITRHDKSDGYIATRGVNNVAAGTTVGITVGVLVGLFGAILLAALGWKYYVKKKKAREAANPSLMSEEGILKSLRERGRTTTTNMEDGVDSRAAEQRRRLDRCGPPS